MGTVREILPEGIDGLADIPHTLFTALRLGLNFLAFEELPTDEQPPRRIWMNTAKLKDWFEVVAKRREEQAGTHGKQSIEDPVENDAASSLISGR